MIFSLFRVHSLFDLNNYLQGRFQRWKKVARVLLVARYSKSEGKLGRVGRFFHCACRPGSFATDRLQLWAVLPVKACRCRVHDRARFFAATLETTQPETYRAASWTPPGDRFNESCPIPSTLSIGDEGGSASPCWSLLLAPVCLFETREVGKSGFSKMSSPRLSLLVLYYLFLMPFLFQKEGVILRGRAVVARYRSAVLSPRQQHFSGGRHASRAPVGASGKAVNVEVILKFWALFPFSLKHIYIYREKMRGKHRFSVEKTVYS